jgi:phosphoglycolate phosphatase
MIEQAARAHGRTLNETELYDLFEIFILHYADNIAVKSRPYDGVITALAHLQKNGAQLAVCTNKLERHARAVLSELGMAGYFSAITGRDTLGVYKPDPGHLTGTIALTAGSVARALMIGDSETDIKTAKAAHVPVIAVDFGYSVEPVATFSPDVVISHYDGLLSAISGLIGAGDPSAPA